MAVKTITIDVEAYELLSRRKREGQSFSEVIKERFGRIRSGRDLVRALESLRVSEEALDRMEDVLRQRRKSPARAVKP